MRLTDDEWNEKTAPIYYVEFEHEDLNNNKKELDDWVDNNVTGWWYRPNGDCLIYSFGDERERDSVAMLIKFGSFNKGTDKED